MVKKDKNSKQSEQSTTNMKVVNIASILITVFSIASLWGVGYIESIYYFNVDHAYGRGITTVLLLGAAVIALIGFVLSIIAWSKAKNRQKLVYIICACLTFGVLLLQVVSAALLNALR